MAPTIAFFGATGGCANSALAAALEAGYECVALARSDAKLRDMLTEKGVSEARIASNLTIVTGDIRDKAVVSSALAPNGGLVDVIISGTGAYPKQFLPPKMTDPTVCEETVSTILSSLCDVSPTAARKPLLLAISTTGVTRSGQRDVPIAMLPLYRWALALPHEDKRAMEDVVVSDARSTSPAIRGYVIVRPSLLTSGEKLGTGKVRVGWETESSSALPGQRPAADGTSYEGKPAVGYTISRADVGQWIFEEVIKAGGDQWSGKAVTLTY